MSSKGHQKSHFHGNSPSVQRRGLFGGKIAIHASENDSHATRPPPPSRELPAIFADSAPLFIPKLGEICEEGRRRGGRGRAWTVSCKFATMRWHSIIACSNGVAWHAIWERGRKRWCKADLESRGWWKWLEVGIRWLLSFSSLLTDYHRRIQCYVVDMTLGMNGRSVETIQN